MRRDKILHLYEAQLLLNNAILTIESRHGTAAWDKRPKLDEKILSSLAFSCACKDALVMCHGFTRHGQLVRLAAALRNAAPRPRSHHKADCA